MTDPAPLALAYLHAHGIPAAKVSWHVECWGCVHVAVRYSRPRYYGGEYQWQLGRRILAANVVLLMTDDGRERGFYLFEASDAVFYDHAGALKTGLTWKVGRKVQLKHEERYYALLDGDMQQARDRLELIEAARLERTKG